MDLNPIKKSKLQNLILNLKTSLHKMYSVKTGPLKNQKLEAKYFPDVYQIARIYKPIIKIMQCLAYVPMIIEIDSNLVYFKVKIFSFPFFFSWTKTIFNFIAIVLFILNREFKIDWPIQLFRKPTPEDGVFPMSVSNIPAATLLFGRLFQAFIPLSALINLVSAKIRFRKLQDILNNWTNFEEEFRNVFDPFYDIQLKNLRKIMKINLAFVFAIFCSAMICQPVFRRLLVTENVFIYSALSSGFGIFITTSLTFPSIITITTLQTIKTAFREIRHGIEKRYSTTTTLETISCDEVSAWIRLIANLKNHAAMFQKCATLPELSDLFTTFITMLALSYFSFVVLLKNVSEVTCMMPYITAVVVFGLVRIYIKCMLADQVRDEEKQIAMTVMLMEGNFDEKTREEMRTLCNLILTDPFQIVFGNMIVLNKKLLLSILSQLATYLIVLLQFKSN